MSGKNLKFTSLDEVQDRLDLLLEGGYEKTGNWSLGQVCNHLATMMKLSQRVRRYRAGAMLQRIGVPIFLRLLFLGRIGRLFKLRIPTAPFARQKRPVDDAGGVKRLILAIENQQCDVTAACATCTRFQLWHCGHHLGFLEPLREPGFQEELSTMKAESQPVAIAMHAE